MKTKKVEQVTLLVMLLVSVVFPFFSGRYMLSVGISVLLMALLGQSWNIMSGYAGQFSFGHAAFFGIGAYASSILYMDYGISPWFGMIIGMALAASVGALIGFLSFRYKLRGDFFALVTLAFAEILRVFVNNTKALKGASGVLIPYKDVWKEFQFANDRMFYFILLAMVIAATAFICVMSYRKFGVCLVAIKENQDAAGSLGVPVLKYKLIAMVISASIAAIAGTFYAQYYGFIDPAVVFTASISVEAIIPCIIGGAGTLGGPLLGALIIIPLQEISNDLFEGTNGVNMIVYGILIVLFVVFCRDGIYGTIIRRLKGARS